jgi:hypothetical protein
MTRILVISLCVLVLSAPYASAQWIVEDPAAIAQRAAIWAQEAAQWIESIANQAREIQATYNVIRQQILLFNQIAQDFQRLPDALNFTTDLLAFAGQVTGLLDSASMVGYDLDRVIGQFDSLYQQLGILQTHGDVFTLRHRLLAGRMEASAMTVKMTAIKTNLVELYTRICSLLSGSVIAHGNLDSAQIAAQQAGLMQHTLETMAAMQATHARNTAQGQAEQAVIERLQLQAIEGAMRDTTPEFTPQGHLPVVRW